MREALARVDDLLATHERVHELLDAVVAIATDLDLRSVLRRIVRAACWLSGARYGALGVLGADQKLSDFITYGLTEAEYSAIGELPCGRGILGLLLEQSKPMRLRQISDHPNFYGFPPHHPPMNTFLGVPLRIGDQVFGNLYLTEKSGGAEFTDEDQQVVEALAAAAGAAIGNARLYAVSERRREWLEATSQITRQLMGSRTRTDAFDLIVRRARSVSDAWFSAIILVDDHGSPTVVAADGADADKLVGLSAEPEVVQQVAKQATPSVSHDVGEVFGESWAGGREDQEGSERVVLAPMVSGDEISGVLLIAKHGAGILAEEDSLFASFANQAALALDLARAHEDREALVVYEDRERIARDLHDLVIQRLFATGMQLQGASRLAVRPEVRERLTNAVADLDATIRDIRTTIFELHTDPDASSLKAELVALSREYTATLGFAPQLGLDGPLDTSVDAEAKEDLLAVARECLSNIARHAEASGVLLQVEVSADRVCLRIADDGVGIEEPVLGSGLPNIRARAEALGGSMSLGPNVPHGTVLEWTVPRARLPR
jgi:signal transduction histidine kinase